MMEGVTAAIVAWIFVCLYFPQMIRNRAQFYAGVMMIVGAMLLAALAMIIGGSFVGFAGAMGQILQTIAFVLMIAATGNVSVKDLGKEFGNVIEVMRRGETEKEIIIPRKDRMGGETDDIPPPPGRA
ncbi:MAG TPA: hypothetical protein VEA69_08330 [Tepidisphaeraceae bacterium]|nr:hypothetical protein [Tepidisphaeraceae bacterium]